jgi:proline dehydrogenase
MPGEELEDALQAAEELKNQGIAATFTLLGENVTSEDEANAVRDHYLDALGKIHERGLDAHLSTKLTQLGLDINADLGFENMRAIAAKAKQLGNFTWLDMESSHYVDVTIDMYRRIHSELPNIGLCLQAYLRRTPSDLEQLYHLDPAIRLVKGAYLEPPEIAFPKKADVDESFFQVSAAYLKRIELKKSNLAYGTHDLRLIQRIAAEADRRGLGKQAPEYHMLYGIQPAEQFRLSKQGYKVRVLIAYGRYWFPWYMRRLAERPANVWFVVKNLF